MLVLCLPPAKGRGVDNPYEPRRMDMTDEPIAPKPARAEVTEAWLAENRAKRLAYEAQRWRHAQGWLRRGEPDPEPESPDPAAASGRARKPPRGKIHDKRQGRLDL